MADGGTEVDEGFALALGDPRLDGADADFHFEGGGDAVAGFVAVVFVGLAVRVEIDEAGGDDEAFRVDRFAAWKGSGADGGDATVADADVAGGVELGFGIHGAAIGDD